MNAIPEAISRASFSSPMGNLVGLASEQGLVALEFEDAVLDRAAAAEAFFQPG